MVSLSVPSTWTMSRVDRVATVNARIGWKALTASEYQSDGFAFLSTPNIKSESIDFENVNYISEYRYHESPELKLQIGDVLLVKDGNTLGITNVVRELPRPATVNGSIAVLRAFGVEPRFLRYVLASAPTQGAIEAIKGGMGVPHLFQWDIKRLPLALPPRGEQCRIANFLDRQTARIDELVALRDAQVASQAEALKSESSRLTGRCFRDHPVGSWDLLPLRRVVDAVQTGLTPTDLLQPSAGDDTVPWYTPAALDGTLGLAEPEKSVRCADLCYVPRFPAKSILIVGIGESLGKVAVLDSEATGNQQLTCIKTRMPADRGFLAWQLYAAHDEIRAWAQYSRIRILNNENLLAFPMMIPSVGDQFAARTELDRRLVDLKRFHAAAARFRALAFEHRQALITAAVTGQIDVTTARGVAV